MPMSIHRATQTPVVRPPGDGETYSVGDISGGTLSLRIGDETIQAGRLRLIR